MQGHNFNTFSNKNSNSVSGGSINNSTNNNLGLEVDTNKDRLFSVIIPVFNTEQFLAQCLQSVKNQSYAHTDFEFECLVINDGSLGLSAEFLDKKLPPIASYQFSSEFIGIEQGKQAQTIFERMVGDDPRFKFFNKTNGGLSDARNFGLAKAEGRYIVFVDSDDWLEPNHLQRFADEVVKFDQETFTILNFPASHYHNNKPIPQFIPRHYSLASAIHRNTFLAWAVLFDNQIIQEFNLKFDTRLGRGSKVETRISDIAEDEFFALQYIEAVITKFGNFKVKLIPHTTYHYREVDKNQKNDEQNRSYLEYAKLVKNYFRDKKALGWQVQLVASVFPYWISLRFTQNRFILLWRKVFNVFLRLISGCY